MTSVATFAVTALLYIKFNKIAKKSNDELDDGGTERLLLEMVEKRFREIRESSQEQTQTINKSFLEIEKRFGQQDLKIDKNFSQIKENNQESLLNMQNHLQKKLAGGIEDLGKANKEKLIEIQQEVDKRLDENFKKNLKSFEEVSKNLGQMKATAERMIDSTKSVDKLTNIFERTSSKSFGDFGEKYLETLLSDTLATGSWQKQVTIPGTQDKIDFVIEIEDKKIGIDSKFPVTKYRDYLEAQMEEKEKTFKEFLKSVMTMSKSISEKYSKDNFLDVILIYLPSDSMYNDVVNNEKVSEYLAKIKMTPASPNTIFPLIKTLSVYQFKSHVNENAQKIIDGLKVVSKNMDSFREEFRKLGDKLRHAQENYDKADRSLLGVQKEVLRLEQVDGVEIE